MMKTIDSKQFYQVWVDVVTNRKQHLQKIWRSNVEFTNHIKSDEDSVLSEIAIRFGLLCYSRDYYSIDAIFYTHDDLVPDLPKHAFWFRNIKIAFEHENNFSSGLYKEVSHLLITNSDLKVLVTYPNGETESALDYLHKIIKGSSHESEISANESFLIILGYENGFTWTGMIYSSQSWKEI